MIRPYTKDDKAVVLSIWRETSHMAHPFLTPAFMQEAETLIGGVLLDMADVWMAEVDSSPVGFVAMLGNEVGGLFVLPDHHGQGLGRALMDKAAELHETLELDVFRDNPIGRRFYAAYGFTEGDTRFDEASDQQVIRLHLTV